MNKKLLLTTILAAIIIAFSGCNKAQGDVLVAVENAPSTIESLAEVQTDISLLQSEEDKSIDLPEDFDYIALGNEYATSLQTLFENYLYFDESQVSLKNTEHTVLDSYDDTDSITTYYEIEDDKIKTYSDLKNIFLEYCTDEFSDKLLKHTSYMYKDVEGKLYRTETLYCFRGYQDTYIVDWEVNKDKVIYTLLAEGDDWEYYPECLESDYVHNTSSDKRYTMTLVYSDGKWLISNCDDASMIGYCFNGKRIIWRNNQNYD